MKIALIGYGKMGKAIESIAIKRGHSISFKISRANRDEIKKIHPDNTDVAIEFTNPEAAFDNISTLLNQSIKTISGSTGWTNRIHDINALSKEKQVSFLWASNFSLGVNLFFNLNEHLARLMAAYTDYEISINEIHHTQKKDAPSGTAITLADQILKLNNHYNNWHLSENIDKKEIKSIPIFAERIDPAPGTHSIRYHSEIDDIEIIHTAHSRDGFALGAVIAAEFIMKSPADIYSMKDVLNLK